MKYLIFTAILSLVTVSLSTAAETANYVFVMFYGNDSEQLLTTIQVDESLKARLEKERLLLEGKGIIAECDLSEYNDTWAVTDADQKIIGISETFPVGRESSWFRISEKDGEFAIEAPGYDISVGFYKSIDDEWPSENIELKRGKRFIFNFEGKTAKVGPEGVQFIINRK